MNMSLNIQVPLFKMPFYPPDEYFIYSSVPNHISLPLPRMMPSLMLPHPPPSTTRHSCPTDPAQVSLLPGTCSVGFPSPPHVLPPPPSTCRPPPSLPLQHFKRVPEKPKVSGRKKKKKNLSLPTRTHYKFQVSNKHGLSVN